MIKLPEPLKSQVRAWRDKVYARLQTFVEPMDEKGEPLPFENIPTVIEKNEMEGMIAARISLIGVRKDLFIDTNCGIVFTQEEKAKGLIPILHDHTTGKILG